MVDKTNNTILSSIFKLSILPANTLGTDQFVTDLHTDYLTKPWFKDLKLVFMYDEKDSKNENVKFNACTPPTEPTDVDDRRTLYYAKVIETGGSNQMELLSKKGFKTEDFVKVRSLVEGLRAAADNTDSVVASTSVMAYLNTVNKEFDKILLDMLDTGLDKMLGGKNNKSSKQRKQHKKNKSSRKH